MIAVDLPTTVFIQNENCVNWWRSENIIQASCEFNQTLYEDYFFKQLEITFPEVLLSAVNKRKAEFLAGRYCARNALAPLGFEHVVVGIGQQRCPIWPENIKGSISHCAQLALAVVSDDVDILGLGIDIEDQIQEEVIEQTSPYILVACEQHLLQQNHLSVEQMFTLIFSIKESFFKAAFPLVKTYFDFDAVTILDVDNLSQEVLFQLNYSLHKNLAKGSLFTAQYCQLKTSNVGANKIASLVTIFRE